MIFKSVCVILVALASISYAQFDDAALWRYYLSNPYNDNPNNDSSGFTWIDDGLRARTLHSNIYGIESFDWNYFAVHFGKGAAGIGIEFSSIGYKEHYQRNRYRVHIDYRINDYISLAPLIELSNEDFGDYGNFTGISGELCINYFRKEFNAGLGLSKIRFKKPYESSDIDEFNPFVSGSWVFDEGLTFSIAVRRFENRRTRWIFDQIVSMNRLLSLNFGYMNNPSNIYGALVFCVNKISLIITYSSVSGLSDSIIWGVSYGE